MRISLMDLCTWVIDAYWMSNDVERVFTHTVLFEWEEFPHRLMHLNNCWCCCEILWNFWGVRPNVQMYGRKWGPKSVAKPGSSLSSPLPRPQKMAQALDIRTWAPAPILPSPMKLRTEINAFFSWVSWVWHLMTVTRTIPKMWIQSHNFISSTEVLSRSQDDRYTWHGIWSFKKKKNHNQGSRELIFKETKLVPWPVLNWGKRFVNSRPWTLRW